LQRRWIHFAQMSSVPPVQEQAQSGSGGGNTAQLAFELFKARLVVVFAAVTVLYALVAIVQLIRGKGRILIPGTKDKPSTFGGWKWRYTVIPAVLCATGLSFLFFVFPVMVDKALNRVCAHTNAIQCEISLCLRISTGRCTHRPIQ
jgi:hypothetical protein